MASPLDSRPQTAVDRVVEQLAARVRKGEVLPGDKLPGEASLADEFSVSRPIIREALGQLRERGYVVTFNGRGSFVRKPDARSIADALKDQLRFTGGGPFDARQLYEVRTAIEIVAVRNACFRATGQQLETLEALLEEMKRVQDDPAAFAAADVAFHIEMARASDNPLLALVLTPLVETIITGMLESHSTLGAASDGIRMHGEILHHVRNRDPDAAAAAMARHLQESESIFPSYILTGSQDG